MIEPSLTSQLLGVGALFVGFIGAGIHVYNIDLKKAEEKKMQQQHDADIIRASQEAYALGRTAERRAIRENVRRPFAGFTFDNEKPEGLKSELLALPQPKG
nr:MAG TPA: hypothetical protein [Caudoviricetes sp.]